MIEKISVTTRNSYKGCLFLTQINTKKSGRTSIKQWAILAWTKFIRTFLKMEFMNMNRYGFISSIKKYFIESY